MRSRRWLSLPRGEWIAPLLILMCTGGVLVLRPSLPTFSGVAPTAVSNDVAGADHYRAYVVLQRSDCDSNLEFLRVFSRPKFRSRIA